MAIYALTGTPATGKTSISKNLDKKVLHLSDLYSEASDKKSSSGEWIIDLEKLNNLVQEKLVDNIIVEGHFAHLMDNMDHIIVLRCDPRELRIRMEKRKYSENKIKENLEAEAIGLIYSEACENGREIELYQHDTTNLSVNESSEILQKIFEGNVKLDENIDYSGRIMDWY